MAQLEGIRVVDLSHLLQDLPAEEFWQITVQKLLK